jgi:hypothetical protein
MRAICIQHCGVVGAEPNEQGDDRRWNHQRKGVSSFWPMEMHMDARELIEGATHGPEALKAIGQAFDDAWAQIAGNFGEDPSEIEAARDRLARAVLTVADESIPDAGALKQAALARVALHYRKIQGGIGY